MIVECGQLEHAAVVGRTFADAREGELLVHVNSAGAVAIAVNGGSAAEALGAGDEAAGGVVAMVVIRRG